MRVIITKWSYFVGYADPKIDKAVNLLQVAARDKYENGKKENSWAPAQKPEDIKKKDLERPICHLRPIR